MRHNEIGLRCSLTQAPASAVLSAMTDADLLARVAPADLDGRVRAALVGCAAAPPEAARGALSIARSLAGVVPSLHGPWRGAPVAGAQVAVLGVPCGLGLSSEPIDVLVEGTVGLLAGVEHGRLGLAGACAVAAGVGAGLLGARFDEAVGLALTAADGGERRGEPVPGPLLSARLSWAVALATRAKGDPVDALDMLVGAGSVVQEAVPAAFAVAALCWDRPTELTKVPDMIARFTCPDPVLASLTAALLGARHGVHVAIAPSGSPGAVEAQGALGAVEALGRSVPDLDAVTAGLLAARQSTAAGAR